MAQVQVVSVISWSSTDFSILFILYLSHLLSHFFRIPPQKVWIVLTRFTPLQVMSPTATISKKTYIEDDAALEDMLREAMSITLNEKTCLSVGQSSSFASERTERLVGESGATC